jgi:hypothetical protein
MNAKGHPGGDPQAGTEAARPVDHDESESSGRAVKADLDHRTISETSAIQPDVTADDGLADETNTVVARSGLPAHRLRCPDARL